MSTPVSVIMPVKCADSFVTVAIDSILAQHNVTVELLIIGAPDVTDSNHPLASLLHQRYQHDSRITLLARSEPGIVNALNTGLMHASGDYIARMDADDIATPDRLYTQLECAKTRAEPCLVSACVELFSDTAPIQAGNQQYQTWLNSLQSPTAIHTACLIESPIPHPSWFAHKSVWRKLGAYSNGDFPEDYEFVLRAWLAGIPMAKPAQILLHWREHPNRLTRTDPRYRREAFTQLKASAVTSPHSQLSVNEGRAVWIVGTGRNARDWHDALEARQAIVAGFVDLDRPGAKQRKRDKAIIGYADLARIGKDALIITAISNPIARKKLCDWFAKHNMVHGRDVILGG